MAFILTVRRQRKIIFPSAILNPLLILKKSVRPLGGYGEKVETPDQRLARLSIVLFMRSGMKTDRPF